MTGESSEIGPGLRPDSLSAVVEPRSTWDGLERIVARVESRRGPFDHSDRDQLLSSRGRAGTESSTEPHARFALSRVRRPNRTVALTAAFVVVIAFMGLLNTTRNSPPPRHGDLVSSIVPASDDLPIANGTGGAGSLSSTQEPQSAPGLTPSSPGSVVNPAPSSVASQPPLRPHEVFGFAPYWTLDDADQFDLSGLTTVDYFSVGINPDGTIAQSGPGWDGFNSENFVDLVNRAHAAGDRVVLTLNDFSQSSLDQLALSQSAPQELANSALYLLKMKDLDGINLDLEGEGSGDQAGITSLVKAVSTTLKAANPDYQVTMDTYASSAGDPDGFYDIQSLNQYVDGFFVMAYQLNLRAAAGSGSPLTSSMFSNQTTVNQYTNAVPASKVILGLPFFGYDWPTSDGTLNAQPDGAPTVVTYAQEVSSGHPIYWDTVTDTAWTSYQLGQQWHEAFFENPQSLYLAAQMAQQSGIGGVGTWALGMDGGNDQAMVSALDGNAPAQKDQLPGPSSTSTSPGPVVVAPLGAAAASGSSSDTGSTTSSSTTTSTTTTTAQPAAAGATPTTAVWDGSTVTLQQATIGAGRRSLVGTVTGFTSSIPRLSCLSKEPSLNVFTLEADPGSDWVIARKSLGDCADATFTFTPPSSSTATTSAGG